MAAPRVSRERAVSRFAAVGTVRGSMGGPSWQVRKALRGRRGSVPSRIRRGPRDREAVLPRVFGLSVTFEDDDSAVFDFGNTIINLLKTAAARELIEPAQVAPRAAGSRLQLTIEVDDVDATCAELAERGVQLLSGPMNRPWGVRTASFRDPGGHIWESRSSRRSRSPNHAVITFGSGGPIASQAGSHDRRTG